MPPEALITIKNIEKGGLFPFPYHDGTTFLNREGILPSKPSGYYKEYTVPTLGVHSRGPHRIVSGENGVIYYTPDHYKTFEEITKMNLIKDVEALFVNKVNPDVYLLSSDAQVAKLSSLSVIHRFSFFYIKGEEIRNKETFLRRSGEALRLPGYYGRNWDAFEECIKDFGWCPAEGYLVLYDHFQAFALNAPAEFKVALAIFSSAIKYWKETNKISMYLLLKDAEDLL